MLLPFRMVEVGMPCTGTDNQIVVVEHRTVRQNNLTRLEIDARSLAKEHTQPRRAPKDPSNGRRDVSGRQRGCGHLVEQRLKDVVIPAIEKRHTDRRPPQHLRRRQPGKPSPDDYDMWLCHSPLPTNVLWSRT